MGLSHHRTRERPRRKAACGLLDLSFWRSLYWRGSGEGVTCAERPATSPVHLTGRSFARIHESYKGALMRTRWSQAVRAGAAGLAVTALLGCSQFSGLKAKMALKDANAAYAANDYRKAIPKYEEAISLDPSLTQAYFYVANSYDSLYKPAKKGEAAN